MVIDVIDMDDEKRGAGPGRGSHVLCHHCQVVLSLRLSVKLAVYSHNMDLSPAVKLEVTQMITICDLDISFSIVTLVPVGDSYCRNQAAQCSILLDGGKFSRLVRKVAEENLWIVIICVDQIYLDICPDILSG